MAVKPKELLKTGMIVVSATGMRGMVLKDVAYLDSKDDSDIILWKSPHAWYTDKLQHFNDNLIDEARVKIGDSDSGQIDKIIMRNKSEPFSLCPSVYVTIWERQKPKEMTVAEIEAALGYPVKIVKEKATE